MFEQEKVYTLVQESTTCAANRTDSHRGSVGVHGSALRARIRRSMTGSNSTASNKLLKAGATRQRRRRPRVPSQASATALRRDKRARGCRTFACREILDQLPRSETRRPLRRSTRFDFLAQQWTTNAMETTSGHRLFLFRRRRRQRPSRLSSDDNRKSSQLTIFNNGRELWKQAWNAEYNDSNGDGPRSTPTWDQGRIYALGATGELRCLDANTGAVIWGKNILSENQASNLQWAQSASPLIVDDKVIVLPGGGGGKSVVAYNKMTGAPVWKALDDRQAYVSPMLVELGGAVRSWS